MDLLKAVSVELLRIFGNKAAFQAEWVGVERIMYLNLTNKKYCNSRTVHGI